jgi:hypothetical protein
MRKRTFEQTNWIGLFSWHTVAPKKFMRAEEGKNSLSPNMFMIHYERVHFILDSS